ncbi:hypothetical protein PR048_032522 [Dryococelus australis]|uniref:Uncharacterized protein n=1 Tax=Dryococelus australis TaxID=614101 RepID=A0ABQ9G2F5_9NEOP|nr:hypothetical protein PR048_032522 [Dryococelus australis]
MGRGQSSSQFGGVQTSIERLISAIKVIMRVCSRHRQIKAAGEYDKRSDLLTLIEIKLEAPHRIKKKLSGASMEQCRGKQEISEKTHRPVASSGTIPTCESLGESRPGIKPGSPRWEANSLTTTLPGPAEKFIRLSKGACKINLRPVHAVDVCLEVQKDVIRFLKTHLLPSLLTTREEVETHGQLVWEKPSPTPDSKEGREVTTARTSRGSHTRRNSQVSLLSLVPPAERISRAGRVTPGCSTNKVTYAPARSEFQILMQTKAEINIPKHKWLFPRQFLSPRLVHGVVGLIKAEVGRTLHLQTSCRSDVPATKDATLHRACCESSAVFIGQRRVFLGLHLSGGYLGNHRSCSGLILEDAIGLAVQLRPGHSSLQFVVCMTACLLPKELGSIPGGFSPEFSHVVIVPDDAAGRRLLACHNRHKGAAVAERLECPPPTKANQAQSPAASLPDSSGSRTGRRVFSAHSDTAPFSPHFTLIGSQCLF